MREENWPFLLEQGKGDARLSTLIHQCIQMQHKEENSTCWFLNSTFFSHTWVSEWQSLSRVRVLATPWTVALQASLFLGFSRQEYWSGLPFPFSYLEGSYFIAPYFQTHNPSAPQRISEPPSAHYVFLSPYLYHHGGPNVKLFLNGLLMAIIWVPDGARHWDNTVKKINKSRGILVFKQLLKPVGLGKYSTCGQHCSHKV